MAARSSVETGVGGAGIGRAVAVGQSDDEGASDPELALDLDLPAEKLDQLPAYGQPEARAAIGTRGGRQKWVQRSGPSRVAGFGP